VPANLQYVLYSRGVFLHRSARRRETADTQEVRTVVTVFSTREIVRREPRIVYIDYRHISPPLSAR